jgi:FKBP-type peptidyl-prolyl cis-trans isomerase SlyD
MNAGKWGADTMTDGNLTVADGLVVDLDLALRLDDGRTISTSEEQQRLVLLQGHSSLMPGLQQAIAGMSVGDEKDVVVAPADGYGERDSDAFELVPLDTFPPDLALTKGMGLKMRDQEGQVHKAYVSEIRPEGVMLDFNHPLAGETLHFHVKIAALRTATPEELAEKRGERVD